MKFNLLNLSTHKYNHMIHHLKMFKIVFQIAILIITIIIFMPNAHALDTSATLLPGTTLSSKMKTIANNGVNVSADTANTNVYAIKKADTLKEGLANYNIISTTNSEETVYMWYEDNTLYYYSEANTIYMNEDSSYVFRTFNNLIDISGLEFFDVSRVTNMGRLFIDSFNLKDLSPLANWDTSNVTNMYFTFGANYTGSSGKPMSLSDLTPLANWNTSNVTTMNSMFKGCASLTTLDSLKNWDVSNVNDMTQMFNRTGIQDASGIKAWNVTKVTSFNMMLANIPSTTVKPIFTYRSGTWNNSGTFTSYAKREITITVIWNDTDYMPNNIKIYLKKHGEISSLPSTDANWIKNDNVWTYKFPVYDSSQYYVWQENVDEYLNDATEEQPKLITGNDATITNNLNFHNIILNTKVTGNMASINKMFNYTVYLYDKNGNPLSKSILINNNETIEVTNGIFTRELQNNQSLIINNIPHGYKYKIVQEDTDYEETFTIEKNTITSEPRNSNETDILLLNENQNVSFTNNKEDVVQTGIITDHFPLLLLSFVGILGLSTIRTMNKDLQSNN